jgi:hypothetical protein
MEQESHDLELKKFFICINNLVLLLLHLIIQQEEKQDIPKTFQEQRLIAYIF